MCSWKINLVSTLVAIHLLLVSYNHTHTQIHPFNGPFSGTTQVSRYQKGKTNLDFTEASDSEWQWHQLGHMQICTSLQTDNHDSTPPLSFLQVGCSSCRPVNSVKALKYHTTVCVTKLPRAATCIPGQYGVWFCYHCNCSRSKMVLNGTDFLALHVLKTPDFLSWHLSGNPGHKMLPVVLYAVFENWLHIICLSASVNL